MNQYHKLYTPADSVIVFIDQQPQMTFGVASADRALLLPVANAGTLPVWRMICSLQIDSGRGGVEFSDA